VRQIRELEHLVAELDGEINRRYAALDPYLRTVPGLGAATAPAIYAEIGDIQRFCQSPPVSDSPGIVMKRTVVSDACGIWYLL
jgi:hypothetical protein